MNAPNGAPRTGAGSALRRLRSGGQGAPALAAASAGLAAASVDRAALAAVVESLRADLWLTDARLGGLVAAGVLAALALAPSFAAVGRRTRPSRGLALGLAISAAGTLLSGAARRALALLAARLATGAGPAALAVAPSSTPRERGFGAAAAVVGTAAGYAVGAALSRVVGWRWALVGASLPGLAAAIAALRARGGPAIPAIPAIALPWRGEDGFFAELGRLRADRERLLAVAGQGAVAFAAAATAFWTPAYLERTRGIPRAAAGVGLAVVVLVAALGGGYAGARAVDRLRTRAGVPERWVAGAAALAAAPLAIAAYAAWRPRTYLAALVLAQLLLFAAARAGAVALAATTPAGGSARAAAAASTAVALFAEAPAAALVGLVSDRTSLGRALAVLVPLALALAGAAWIACARGASRSTDP